MASRIRRRLQRLPRLSRISNRQIHTRQMQNYYFRVHHLHFQVPAQDEKDAVRIARRAIEESSSNGLGVGVQLDGGVHTGWLYIEPGEITVANIYKATSMLELNNF